MDVEAGSSSPSDGGDTYRRIRRDSYSAAMINETEIGEEEMERQEVAAIKSQRSIPPKKWRSADDSANFECETWSVESCALKRDLARTSSTDTSRSWTESVEIPSDMLPSHPELWARLGMGKCRSCFPKPSSSFTLADGCQCQCLCQCRCSQCHYYRRKISTCSSRDHPFLGYKRKDSGYSVSTCQSILPPSSGRNSIASLLHEIKEGGPGGREEEKEEEEEVMRRRHSDQTQCGRCSIGRVDNRRFSEQTLARGLGPGIIIEGGRRSSSVESKPCLPPAEKLGSRRAWCKSLEKGESGGVAEPWRERMEGSGEVVRQKRRRERKEESSRESSMERRRSSVNITPKMMRRRFSEQLILEGGLGSVQDYEDLVEEGEEGAEEESLTAANARKRITLRRHYYPEGGWGRAIVSVAILVQLICHGVQLGSAVLLAPMAQRFPRDAAHTGRDCLCVSFRVVGATWYR